MTYHLTTYITIVWTVQIDGGAIDHLLYGNLDCPNKRRVPWQKSVNSYEIGRVGLVVLRYEHITQESTNSYCPMLLQLMDPKILF